MFEQWGALRWEKETAFLQDLQFLPEGGLAYLEELAEGRRLVLLEDEDEAVWQKEACCAAVSDDGGFAALCQEGRLEFYQLQGNSSAPRLL